MLLYHILDNRLFISLLCEIRAVHFIFFGDTINFSVPTIDEVKDECFEATDAPRPKGFRQNAWLKLLELAKTKHGYDHSENEWTRALRHVFFQISRSNIPLIEAKILAGRDSGWSHSRTLGNLYKDLELDLIDGEGHHWMKVFTEQHEIRWPNFAISTEIKFDPKEEFCRLLDQYYDERQLSRKQTWEKIKHILGPPEPVGLFVSRWPFDAKEFRGIAEDNGGTRLDMYNVLIEEMIITPGDTRELRAFRCVFYRSNPAPKELSADILKRKREMPWNRDGIKEELRRRFGDQLIPGELDFNFDMLWPV